MNVFQPFWAALNGAIQAAWPDVTRIERVVQADRINWNNAIDKKALVAPWAVTQLPAAGPSDDGPADGVNYELRPTVHYVAQMEGAGGDTAAFIEQKVSDLQDYLLENALPFTLYADMTVDVSEGNPINVVMLQADMPYLAGSLTFRCLTGFIPA